jgi:hypothetical protein
VDDCYIPQLVRGHAQPALALEDLSPSKVVRTSTQRIREVVGSRDL